MIEQVIKGIWFKRNELSQHDLVTQNREAILQNFERLKSARTFYFFIAKVFEHISDKKVLESIVSYLEDTYDMIPERIRRKTFLMHDIYQFLAEKNIVPIRDNKECSFSKFLNFEDYELVKHCFDKERSMKGLILKDIKRIFNQASNTDG